MGKIYDWFKENNIHFLILGFIFSVFSIGRFNIIISIYIWPFCFLYFLHENESKVCPLIAVSLCLILSNIIRWIGSSNTNIGHDILFGTYFSVINIIPFIIDDIFYNKIEKWQNIFLFPLSVVICEFSFSFVPFANFNIYAYAHRENIQFLQIISLFGCYFLSFVIALFSSILQYSINLYKEDKTISKFIYLYISIILIIYFFGLTRLLIPEEKGTYNIAASIGLSQYLYTNGEESVLPIEAYIEYINNTMKRAKDSGADIMTYAEEAFAIYDVNKTKIIEEVKQLAVDYDIFVLLALDIAFPDKMMNTNEAILISNKGKVLYKYQKQHLIPIMEKDYFEEMDKVEVIETDLGKITVVICYDINFPYYINSLSREHFDILLVPSWDWVDIAEFHSNEVKYRAIEGGFNLVKNTANGIVISNDYKGRTLSYYIGKDCEDYFVISTVNSKGVKTLYSYIGFLFNYIYIIAFICLFIPSIIKKKIESDERKESSYEMKFNLDNED
jgi:apolipoprotein N-acyltransferase